MEEFVAYIIKNLVSAPEAVSITTVDSEEALRVEVRVAQEDVGKVIGRRGNTINALRTIVRTVATRLGKKVQVELIQEEGDRPARTETVAESAPEAEAPEAEAPEAEAPEAPEAAAPVAEEKTVPGEEEASVEEAAPVEEPALT